jgi:hypothetical protein
MSLACSAFRSLSSASMPLMRIVSGLPERVASWPLRTSTRSPGSVAMSCCPWRAAFHLRFGEGVDIAVLALHLAAALHGHRLQTVGVGTHRQHAGIGRAEVTDEATVADTREADEHVGGLAGDDEVAGRCRHAAIDERGVTRTEHGDVDKLHGLSLLVDDAPVSLRSSFCMHSTKIMSGS